MKKFVVILLVVFFSSISFYHSACFLLQTGCKGKKRRKTKEKDGLVERKVGKAEELRFLTPTAWLTIQLW